MTHDEVHRRDARIVGLRCHGMSCPEVAKELGIPEHIVYQAMRRTGNAGRWNVQGNRKSRATTLEGVIRAHGMLTLELGIDEDGFIATIDDKWTGVECSTIHRAIQSAAAVYQSAPEEVA